MASGDLTSQYVESVNKGTSYPQKTRYGVDSNPNDRSCLPATIQARIPTQGLRSIDYRATGSCLSEILRKLP